MFSRNSPRRVLLSTLCILSLVIGLATPQAAHAEPSWTVSLTAEATSLPASSSSTKLTAQPSAALTYGYYTVIIDANRTVKASCPYSSYSCVATVSLDPGTSNTYTALIVYGTDSTAIDRPISTSTAVKVFRGTWSLSLSTPDTTLSSSEKYAQVFASTTPFLAPGYGISIFDQTGTLLRYCTSDCSSYATVPSSGLASVWAFVTKGQPASGSRPSVFVTSAGPLSITNLDESALLQSSEVGALQTSLIARYGTELAACVAIGEAARTHAARSSVPDVTLVCMNKGLAEGLKFLSRILGLNNTIQAIETLVAANTDPEPANPQPDCDFIGFDGTCLDEGSPSTSAPTPEPDPMSGGIRPPPNCMDNDARHTLIEVMPEQLHHVATRFGQWADRFNMYVSKYGLDVADNAGEWNVIMVPHRGPHPAEYHQWVLSNLEAATRVAGDDKALFLSLYREWVVNVVTGDPTITRLSYWKCHR